MLYDKQSAAYKVHQSRRWKTISKRIRHAQPVCPDPYHLHAGQYRATAHAHHIVAIEVNPLLAYEESNILALCVECHNHVELLYQRRVDTIDHLRYVRLNLLNQLQESKIKGQGGAGELPSHPGRSGILDTDPQGGVKCLNPAPWPPPGTSSLLRAENKGGGLHCERLSPVQVYCCRMKCARVTPCGSCRDL